MNANLKTFTPGPINIKNPFRHPIRRAAFAECIRSYEAAAGGIRRVDGTRPGNGVAYAFWLGFDNRDGGRRYKTSADRELMGYVYYCAGRAVRAALAEAGK